MGVNLVGDTWRVNKKYGMFSVIQRDYLSCDGVLLSKCRETIQRSSRCFNSVKLNLTLTINPNFLMCLSIIGGVTT